MVGLMFVGAAAVWPYAPDALPVHFGISGEANRYGGRVEGLLSLPVVALGVLLLLKLLPRFDPRRDRYAEFATAYGVATLAIQVFLALVYAVMLGIMLGAPINPTMVIVPLVGVLLVALGAILDHVKPNWLIGIRTPWTLSSEHAWTATHRAGKWVFMAMGALLVLAGIVQTPWLIYVGIMACIVGTLGLVAYSFVVWRGDQRRPAS